VGGGTGGEVLEVSGWSPSLILSPLNENRKVKVYSKSVVVLLIQSSLKALIPLVKATPLASKIPIVDYKIHLERNKPYFKIIRADGVESFEEVDISFSSIKVVKVCLIKDIGCMLWHEGEETIKLNGFELINDVVAKGERGFNVSSFMNEAISKGFEGAFGIVGVDH
nr:hypothetical protein [Tanacetum cinerariifolium]